MSSHDRFLGWHTIKDDQSPYMTRIWIGRLRLHIFHRGDSDADPHDHPWNFWTFPLTPYVEEVVQKRSMMFDEDGHQAEWSHDGMITERFRQIVPAWRLSYRPATHCHRVLGRYLGPKPFRDMQLYAEGRVLCSDELHGAGRIVTVVWRSKVRRSWGFLKHRDGKWCWVYWRDYVFGSGKQGPCE